MYWWNGVDSQNMQLGKMNISTIYGISLAGDSVVVPFMTGNVISLNAMRIRYKKTNPELVDYVDKRVLKGGKRLWETIAAEPMLFLEICKDFKKIERKNRYLFLYLYYLDSIIFFTDFIGKLFLYISTTSFVVEMSYFVL